MARDCKPCAAATAKRAGSVTTKYRWTSEDGMEVIDYDDRLTAAAKVSRKGGSYHPVDVSGNQE